MAAHLVLITVRAKPGALGEAERLFREMHPVIKDLAPGLTRSIFFRSVADPDTVGCLCIWASRADFLSAADDPVYQRTVTEYFAAPVFAGAPGHTAYDVLFDRE